MTILKDLKMEHWWKNANHMRLWKTQEMAQPIKCLPCKCKDMNWMSTAHVPHEYCQTSGTGLGQILDGGPSREPVLTSLILDFWLPEQDITSFCYDTVHGASSSWSICQLSSFCVYWGCKSFVSKPFFFISKLETKVSIISSRHRPWWKATTCKPWCWPSFRCSRATVDASLFWYARQSWCSKNKLLCVSGLTDMARSRGKNNVFFSWVTLHNIYVDDLF